MCGNFLETLGMQT